MAEGQSATGTLIGRSRTTRTLLAVVLALLGAQCPLPLPALLESDPPDGSVGSCTRE
jgi:hypothetical protein